MPQSVRIWILPAMHQILLQIKFKSTFFSCLVVHFVTEEDKSFTKRVEFCLQFRFV
jgi:hypothetical protein